MTWSYTGSGTVYIMGGAPMCECGQGAATQNVRFGDGRPGKTVCPACVERIRQDVAVVNAGIALEQLFLAIPPASRPKLYRQLASVLHPDTGADTRLMVALNAVRERHP